jgi:hypothetical protein
MRFQERQSFIDAARNIGIEVRASITASATQSTQHATETLEASA